MAEGYGFINGGLTDNLSARLIVVNRVEMVLLKTLGPVRILIVMKMKTTHSHYVGKMITILLTLEEMKEVMEELSVQHKVQVY